MTKESTIRRQHDGRQLHQRAPLDFKELTSSSFVRAHRRERNVTWNRTSSLFCRLVVALSIIAVTAGHSERSPLNLDLEAEFFNAVESSHQTFDDTYHPEKGRRLQDPVFDGTLAPGIPPTFPPFIVPPTIPLLLNTPTPGPTTTPTPQPTNEPTLRPTAAPNFPPTLGPTLAPTPPPIATIQPTQSPTLAPVAAPTFRPTPSPVAALSQAPVLPPSPGPTRGPTRRPTTQRPTRSPIEVEPIEAETIAPSPPPIPTRLPSRVPTPEPTPGPTRLPSRGPTPEPSLRPTRRPTNEPTLMPSSRPSRQPTNEPTPRPTRLPTRAPTIALTPIPTPRPSRQPTNSPTSEPTEQPTRRPTPRPTRSPTDRPTSSPTRRPSPVPTRSPTRGPTGSPTRSPTNIPTRAPTSRPTRAPTFRPSRPPNDDPTVSPSLRPSARPTRRPTPNPTNRPTLIPTPFPTVSPTTRPSASPSLTPTQLPTPIASAAPSSTPSRSPSLRPSASPSISPTDSPSAVPSSSPSMVPSVSFQPSISSEPSLAPTPDFEFTLITLEAFRVIMEFSIQGDGRRLQEDFSSSNSTEEECTAMWVDYVTQSMKNEVQQVIPRYETLNVQTYNVSRDTFEELGVLAFFYDVRIDIRSAIIVHNLRRYIGGPFDSSNEQNALVNTMRASSCPEYANLSAIRVILPDDESNNSGATRSEDSPASSGVIAGSVVAVAGAAMLFAIFIFTRIKRKRDVFEEIIFDGTQPQGQFGWHPNEMASEIGLQADVDVSTLGDPIPQGAFINTGDMSTAGSYSLDYDYKAYDMHQDIPSITEGVSRGGGGESLSNTLVSNTLVPADDDTFEAQYGVDEPFEVLAPAGVLGLILETNEDGVPTINNIKPASALAEQVQIGDRLLSVDGIDVSIMLASDVSRLIASRKEAPVRKFLFARPMKGTATFDEDYQSIE